MEDLERNGDLKLCEKSHEHGRKDARIGFKMEHSKC
jgi:hypothetical protein